jgi:Transglutaminase-like superfamily
MLVAGGLDAALGPPPPPPLPKDAERGVRAALRRLGESCLVNAIVLQAWEAAHGRRRDLVIGITGPNDFSAHAWLQGDRVPTADEAIDASVLRTPHGEGSPLAAQGWDPRGAAGGDGAPLTPFNELLRRPAPDYLDASAAKVR